MNHLPHLLSQTYSLSQLLDTPAALVPSQPALANPLQALMDEALAGSVPVNLRDAGFGGHAETHPVNDLSSFLAERQAWHTDDAERADIADDMRRPLPSMA